MARCRPERLQLTAHSHSSATTASSSDEIWGPKDRDEYGGAGDRKPSSTFLKNRSRPHTPWASGLSAQTRRGPHTSPRLPALFATYSVSLLAYLVPILARPQAKDSVTKGVEGVAEVRALEAMAVQHLQSVEHPSNGEACATKVAKGTFRSLLQPSSQTRVSSPPRPFPKCPSYYPSLAPTCSCFLALIKRPANLNSLSSLLDLLLNLPQLCTDLRHRKRWL